MALAALAGLNAYVFLGEGVGLTPRALSSAAIRGRGPLPPLANPPKPRVCDGDPVETFARLGDLVQLSTTIAPQDTLRLSLLDLGTTPSAIDEIESAIRAKVDPSLIMGMGVNLRVALDRSGTIHGLELEPGEGRVIQACRAANGFAVQHLQHPLRTDVALISVRLGGNPDLAEALIDAGERGDLARQIAEILTHDVDFLTEARPGDRIQVMVEKRWLGRRFHRYGKIVALRYVGAAGRVAYYRYDDDDGRTAYYNRKGAAVRRQLLRSPLAFWSVRGDQRPLLVPSIEVVEGRIGATYRVPEGAPVVALASGRVRDAGDRGHHGHSITLDLDHGYSIRYSHLLRSVGGVQAGDNVRQGQMIALTGHTGRTATDRLRVEMWKTDLGDQACQDPLVILSRGARRPPRVDKSLPAKTISRFVDDIRPWRRALLAAG